MEELVLAVIVPFPGQAHLGIPQFDRTYGALPEHVYGTTATNVGGTERSAQMMCVLELPRSYTPPRTSSSVKPCGPSKAIWSLRAPPMVGSGVLTWEGTGAMRSHPRRQFPNALALPFPLFGRYATGRWEREGESDIADVWPHLSYAFLMCARHTRQNWTI